MKRAQVLFPAKESRARKLIKDGKIAHNAQLKVFTVAGSTGNYVTTLFPKETCTCPAKKDCYHILAAKLSIGMNMEAKKPAYLNLTQLHRNSCSKKRKSQAGRDLEKGMLK